jgi:predicted RNA-binding protein (virulence factor B family)
MNCQIWQEFLAYKNQELIVILQSMEIGKYNLLTIDRKTEPGCFLVDNEGNDVLLPNAYVTEDMRIADDINVFIYKDSEDRFVATTLTPAVQLNQFAYLQVKEVNDMGAFLNWGLPKDLMVPYKQQVDRMEVGQWYLIYLLLDEKTERLYATSYVNEFYSNNIIDLQVGDKVSVLLTGITNLGMNAIVNNQYKGLIFHSDIHKSIYPGDKISAYIKTIREDGKIDLVLEPQGYEGSIEKQTDTILAAIKNHDGFLALTDKSSPEDISRMLGLSKKAFKRSVGNLYKQKLIEITETGLKLL